MTEIPEGGVILHGLEEAFPRHDEGNESGYEALDRAMSERVGVHVEFPSRGD